MATNKEPTDRFTGLANAYALHRPSYPVEAIDYIVESCGLNDNSLVVDVGCGTGISSRLFAERGIPVIGVEPNADMRKHANDSLLSNDSARNFNDQNDHQLNAHSKLNLASKLEFRDGTAEATGVGNAEAAVVLAAQAFHWFDRERSLKEFYRILKVGGHVILVWNERDESDDFTSKYGKVIRATSDAAKVELMRGRAGYALLETDLFEDGSVREFFNEQTVDEEGLLGRAFSTSYTPKEGEPARKLEQDLRALFKECATKGSVTFRYATSVYKARKA
jgi:Methylase involved in ubiquinone/menaquinone biosynthesis